VCRVDAKNAEHKAPAHHEAVAVAPTREAVIRNSGGTTREEAEAGGAQPALLHSGPLLGAHNLSTKSIGLSTRLRPVFNRYGCAFCYLLYCDCVGNLPAFGKNQVSPKKFQSEVDQALRDKPAPFRTGNPNSLFGGAGGVPSAGRAPSLKADDKTAGKKNKKRPQEDLPKDTPAEFVCQLTHRLMSEPVKTVYGNVYDKTAIVNWLNTQGKICPLTGGTTCTCVLRRGVLLWSYESLVSTYRCTARRSRPHPLRGAGQGDQEVDPTAQYRRSHRWHSAEGSRGDHCGH
jgi:hypothetical protein